MQTACGVVTVVALLLVLLLPAIVAFSWSTGLAVALVGATVAAAAALVCRATPIGLVLQIVSAFELCLALAYLLTTATAADLLSVSAAPTLAFVALSAAVPPLE